MTYSSLLLLIALTCAAQSRSVIVLPAGPAVDPSNRNATILDIETWKPIGNPAVGIDAYQAFTLPDGSKTYVVAKGAANTVTVLAELSSGGRVLKSIDLPAGSTDAALTPDGKRLLIVSMTDPALTVINTQTDRVIARVPLAAPANSVVVNFESTRAFTASPTGAILTAIDLGRNITHVRFPLEREINVTSQLVFAPNGMLYIFAGDSLNEIDPLTFIPTATKMAASGATGRPLFVFDGSQVLIITSDGLSLAGLRHSRGVTTYSAPGVSIDRVRIVSELFAIGYSSADRTYYRIELKPTLAVTRLTSFGEFSTDSVTSISSTPETPQNRYLFLSSGKAVHRLDLATNSITASQSISAVSGLAISPSQPSKARVTRFYPIGLNQTIGVKDPTLPLVIRALDDTGLPVLGALVSFEASLDINPHVRQQTMWTTTNSDGYAQRRFVLQYTGPDDWTGYANVRENDGLLERFVIKRSLWTDELVVPNKLSIQRGNGQIVYSSKEAPSTLEVLVTGTRYSEVGVANVPVKWAIVGGRGQLKWQQTITDSRGIATNTFTGPVLAGLAELLTSTIQATAAFTSPARFSMTTIPQVSASGNQIGAVLGLQRLFPRDQSLISATSGSMIAGGLRYKLAAGRGIGLDVRVAGESVCQPSMPDRLSRLMKPPATDDDGIVGCDLVARKAIGRGIAQVYIGGQYLEDLPIHVVAGPPRRITIVSGSTGYGYWRIAQSPGRPAVAIVDDGWGNALNDVPVRWDVFGRAVLSKTVLKSAAASYSNIEHPSISHTSDGVVSTDVSLASPAVYTEIGVAVVSNLSVNAVALLVEPASITKLDGDGQSTPAAANFTRPLVVEVPTEYYFGRFFAAGLVINFRATGGLVLSSAVAFTDAQGRAEVSVLAGSTVGTHTVTATAGILTTTFQLTVAAPAIISIVNGASFAPGLSPCAMAQLTGRNFAVGTYIAIGGHPAPLYSSSATSISFQVPCELPPGPTPLQLTSASESVIQQVTIAPYAPGVFENAGKQAVALRADGTYVSATNPAELGEEIRLFATGLGQASPLLATNTPGSGERVNAKVLIGLGNEGIKADAVYAPTLTGTYIVTFRIPRSIAPGANRPIGVAIQTPDGSFIHSQPSRIDIRQ